MTRLLPILETSLKQRAVRVVVYIGDVFEESLSHGRRLADAMGHQGNKLIGPARHGRRRSTGPSLVWGCESQGGIFASGV